MWTYTVVKDKVISQVHSKKADIMNNIKVLSDKLVLNRSIVTLDEAIDLRAMRITEVMRYFIFLEFLIKVAEEFRAVITLQRQHRDRANKQKASQEVRC